ncbi:MAG: hypothetical protein K9K67_12140 [Bacteriovoracaceae bacterium]|nr:hypothetical protein [Bacteriovoracaceae bacterium]
MKRGFLFFFIVFGLEARITDLFDRSGITSSEKFTSHKSRFLVGTLNQNLSPSLATHIIVVGSAMSEDSDQFFQSALLRGKIFQDLYPNHQVVIISQPDVIKATQEEVFGRFGVKIVATEKGQLTAAQLYRVMAKFEQIASFDFYGHASPWSLRLGQKDASMYPSKGYAKLKDRFMKGAYATLNGCNTGFNMAPGLSKLWNIPVSGTLTGALFERLQADDHWYKKPDRTRSEWVTQNRTNFEDARSCSEGVCWRLKAQRNSYASYWGYFKEGGLSFSKFFCNYSDSENSCLEGMAKSLLASPSTNLAKLNPSWEEFEAKVFDQLCSTALEPEYFEKCVEGIKKTISNGERVFQMHPGNALQCDFNGCNARVDCDQSSSSNEPKPGSCHLQTVKNSNPTTLVNEYLNYKRAFENL